MPARNALKLYLPGGTYHVYNRGVEKRVIYQNRQDYLVFLNILKLALSEPAKLDIGNVRRRNFANDIEFIAFCLMPSHFHFLIRQQNQRAIVSFMRSVMSSYTCYFNRKYDRVGTLLQGRYKAYLVEDDNHILHISRYIHQNPLSLGLSVNELSTYPYSSLSSFLGKRRIPWVHPESVIEQFDSPGDYERFVAEIEPALLQR